MSMLPAATSCSSGFHKWVRLRSPSVTGARPRLPRRSPRRVASSRPPAPPPTTTMRCALLTRHRLAAGEERRPEPAPAIPFVEEERGIHEAVLELVERAVHGRARGHAVARL